MIEAFFVFFAPMAHAATVGLEVGIGSQGSVTHDYPLLAYIEELYIFLVSAIGIIAAAMIMLNGLRWAAAAGNPEMITSAKNGITGAVVGLILALSSYVILFTINPQLVSFQDLDMQQVTFPAAQGADGEGDEYGASTSTATDFTGCTKSSFTCIKSTYPWLDGTSVSTINSTIQSHIVAITVEDGTGNTLNLRVHEDAQADFEAAFAAIKASNESRSDPYPIRTSDTAAFSGARANVNKPSCPSNHSFGFSIDVNWTTNPNCSKSMECYSDASKHDMPSWVVSAFTSNNFKWGGNWSTVKDYMHFDWNGHGCGS